MAWTYTKIPADATDTTTACGTASGGVDANNILQTTATLRAIGKKNGKVTYTVTGTIDPSATGTLNNTAMATPGSTNFDRNPADNTSSG